MTFSSDAWPECGIARFLTLLDGPWATLVVRELLVGPLRFTDLKNALPGISAHTLTNRLRRFEDYGVVTRTVYPEIPPRVEYELTEIGQELRAVLDAMNAWGRAVREVDDDRAVAVSASCAASASTERLADTLA